MEPDTLAYDGDAAAWEQWQVPPLASRPPVPVFHRGTVADGQDGGASAGRVRPASPSCSPTLQQSAPTSPTASGLCGTQGADAASAPTLHYSPPSSPGGISGYGSRQGAVDHRSAAAVTCETQVVQDVEAQTLAYDTQAISGLPDMAIPNPFDEPTLNYDTQAICGLPDVGSPQAFVPAANAFVATLNYDTQAVSGLADMGPPSAYVPTLNYGQMDLPGELPPTLAYEEDLLIPNAEEIAPTLDYGGEETLRPNVVAPTSPKTKQPTSVIPGSNEAARAPRDVAPDSPGAGATSRARARAEVADEPLFATTAAPAALAKTSSVAQAHATAAVPAVGAGPAPATQDMPIFAATGAQLPPMPSSTVQVPQVASADPAPPEPKRRRLRGKQPAAVDLQSPWPLAAASSTAAPSSRPRRSSGARSAGTGSPSRPASSIRAGPALAVRVSEAGTEVIVRGDGWGGGHGEYLATVTETDPFTYTVIRQFEGGKVEETHVLREHCNVVSEPSPGSNARRARRSR